MILADALGDDAEAQRPHQRFKWRVITPLRIDESWTLTDRAVVQFVDEITARILAEEGR